VHLLDCPCNACHPCNMLAHSIATHPARMFATDAQHLALLQLNRPAQRFNLTRSLGDSLAL